MFRSPRPLQVEVASLSEKETRGYSPEGVRAHDIGDSIAPDVSRHRRHQRWGGLRIDVGRCGTFL